MSAIWGHIVFEEDTCSVSTMDTEFKRKCKLDKIKETHFKNALFGFGLQIINKEDYHEDMPYILDDGNTILTADCILDNREELLSALVDDYSGNDDYAIPNGQLLCLAYEKWHYDFIKHLKGIYSIAIYDSSKESLFLCTDRTASRCLYYYKENNQITFSTLISPIRKLYQNLNRNEMYIKDFLLIPGLMPNISSSETPWENVFIIEAGCSITITKDEISVNRYWEPQSREMTRDIDELKEQFLKVYSEAVSRAIRTEGEVAISLSGGFDSASVAAMAAPKLSEIHKKLISYTYVPHYDMKPLYDKRQITNESGYVVEIAKMYPNIETNFTDNDGKSFWGYLDELVDIMEIPYKAYVNLPLLMEIYRAANKKGCKIFLNGQTGNASVSFGNIDSAVLHLARKGKIITAAKYFNHFSHIINAPRMKTFPEGMKVLLRNLTSSDEQIELDEDNINPFVNKELLKTYSLKERNKTGIGLGVSGKAYRYEQMKNEVYTLPALSYIGAMETKLGLYSGVVIRDATRDPDILDYCISIPFEYYSYNGIPRYLIRGFMKDLLPNCIIYPVLKTGIQSADWIYRVGEEHNIRNVLRNVLCNSSYKSYINSNSVKAFIDQKVSFTKENELKYMYLFIICVFSKFMDSYK